MPFILSTACQGPQTEPGCLYTRSSNTLPQQRYHHGSISKPHFVVTKHRSRRRLLGALAAAWFYSADRPGRHDLAVAQGATPGPKPRSDCAVLGGWPSRRPAPVLDWCPRHPQGCLYCDFTFLYCPREWNGNALAQRGCPHGWRLRQLACR